MGFLQNALMKKSFKFLTETVTSPEMNVELISTPTSLRVEGYKFSDNLIQIALSSRLAVFLLYKSIPSQKSADAYAFGTATNEQGEWIYNPNDLVLSPFVLDVAYDEGISILVESAYALSLLDIVRSLGDDDYDDEDVEFASHQLDGKYDIDRDCSDRLAIIKVIRAMGKRHPSIALGSMFIN